MIYRFVVGWAASKDSLMAGQVVAGYSAVEVEAPDRTAGRLLAEQIVAARGHEPTCLEELAR